MDPKPTTMLLRLNVEILARAMKRIPARSETRDCQHAWCIPDGQGWAECLFCNTRKQVRFCRTEQPLKYG